MERQYGVTNKTEMIKRQRQEDIRMSTQNVLWVQKA